MEHSWTVKEKGKCARVSKADSFNRLNQQTPSEPDWRNANSTILEIQVRESGSDNLRIG
jgi:hypothetical protein